MFYSHERLLIAIYTIFGRGVLNSNEPHRICLLLISWDFCWSLISGKVFTPMGDDILGMNEPIIKYSFEYDLTNWWLHEITKQVPDRITFDSVFSLFPCWPMLEILGHRVWIYLSYLSAFRQLFELLLLQVSRFWITLHYNCHFILYESLIHFDNSCLFSGPSTHIHTHTTYMLDNIKIVTITWFRTFLVALL